MGKIRSNFCERESEKHSWGTNPICRGAALGDTVLDAAQYTCSASEDTPAASLQTFVKRFPAIPGGIGIQ